MKKLMILLAMMAGMTAAAQQEFKKDYYFKEGLLWYRPLTDSTAEVLPCQENCSPLPAVLMVPMRVSDERRTYVVTRLGSMAFTGPSGYVRELVLPESIEEIGEQCFNGSALATLSPLPALRRIERGAFAGCSLTAFHVPATVEYIAEAAFYQSRITTLSVDTANGHYRMVDGVLFSSDTSVLLATVYNYSGSAGQLSLPMSVRRIGDYSLASLSSQLTELVLPEGLREIGECGLGSYAWAVELPSTVVKIKGNPTCGSTQPPFMLTVSEQNTHYRVDDGQLMSTDGDTLFMVMFEPWERSYAVPDGVKVLGENLFCAWGSRLDTVLLPEGLTDIRDGAFDRVNCEVSIPSTVRKIGAAAFRMNRNMRNLVLPRGLKALGAEAFAHSNIVSLTLPDSLEIIERAAFKQCTQFLRVESWGSCLREIHPEAFYQCVSMNHVPTFPPTMQSIGREAFWIIYDIAYMEFEQSPAELGDRLCALPKIRFGDGNPPQLYGETFLQLDTVHVPCGMAEVYRGAALLGWGDRYTYVEDCDGIGEAETSDGLTVAVRGLDLQVAAADGAPVRVLDALGRTLYHGPAATLRLPAAGIYLVHTPGHRPCKLTALP